MLTPKIQRSTSADGLFGDKINLHRLEIFVSVAETGSMSAAAEKFGLSQSAVSQAIAKLEEASGIDLFDRSIRPPVLTLKGATFFKHASDVVESVRRLQSGLRFEKTAQLPILRVGMLNSFATTLGPFIIKSLQETAVQWFVDTGYEASRIIALLDRRCDFVITADEASPPPGLIALPIFSESYRIILPLEPEAADKSALERIAGMSMIRFGRDPHMLSRIDHWLAAAGVETIARYHLDTVEGAAQMVASGLGWSLLPPLAFFRLIERGDRITSMRFPGVPIRRTISIVAREDEGAVIAKRIQQTALELINDIFLPSLKKHAPDAFDDIEVHDGI
ncbi:LysR family transcriptional regulator [Rhizobium mayense]|uniref:LysR family transcriptional regulator n=1 Tax=Rhizobium mayense TaxID=1312184 RepID=A0ABT7JT68_9HYPH|nr:LysR family transcriptional regulator [Rhizobium mayense]MDL2398913.1 LysR family transcriptional regulator [Rhizobium mayense]